MLSTYSNLSTNRSEIDHKLTDPELKTNLQLTDLKLADKAKEPRIDLCHKRRNTCS